MKSIQILIAPDGSTQLETVGFSGSECREASRLLEAALGTVTDERLTPAFYQPAHQQQQAELGNSGGGTT